MNTFSKLLAGRRPAALCQSETGAIGLRATLGLLVALGVSLAGCGRQTEQIGAVTEALVVGPEYSASKGLYVPEATRQSLGLKIIDADDATLVATREISLRVFEQRGDRARASGVLGADEAEGIGAGTEMKLGDSAGATTGKVVAIGRQGSATSGTVELIIEFPATDNLPVGGFATAILTLPATGVVTTVPKSAVVRSSYGDFVYTVSGEHFVRTQVKTGATNGERVEIKDGLYSGDRVVAEPALSLWLTELAAINGGHSCCVVPPKGN